MPNLGKMPGLSPSEGAAALGWARSRMRNAIEHELIEVIFYLGHPRIPRREIQRFQKLAAQLEYVEVEACDARP